jgi:DNA-binding NarL/FixJ family response regulator
VIHRVLIVDDYEPWRRHVASTLQDSSRWQVVGEAVDGREAIEQAIALRPDLILLDIGLPAVNGIEAARRILAHNAALKILFVSEHHSVDIVEAALCTGGRGYVCKSDAGRELTHAMEAIVTGGRFIGTRLGGRALPKKSSDVAAVRRHEVVFYADQTALVDGWARLARRALDAGDSFIVIATEPLRQKLRDLLQQRGTDVARAIRDGRYIALDAPEMLSSLLVDGWPNETRFWNTAIPLLMASSSAAPRRRVVACGEAAPVLCAQGKADAAIRLEELWGEACRMFALDVFCGYLTTVPLEVDGGDVFERLCAVHTAVHSS